jgi:glucose-6-phosphate isomerase
MWIQSDDVGFFKLPHKKFQHEEITLFCNNLPENIDTFLLIGIGGSSLGPKTLHEALQKSSSKKRLFCLENVDPDTNHNVLAQIIPKKHNCKCDFKIR